MSSLILLTGGTGHLGFKALRDALDAGYRVRAAVRSQAKADSIRNNPLVKATHHVDNIEFIIVPDLSVPGAYDEAVKGVDYIIHIASPITQGYETQEDFKENLIKPAVTGTVGILDSANKAPSVKRIVITSSLVAVASFPTLMGATGEVINSQQRVPFDEGPYPAEFAAYSASKVLALNKAEEWTAQNKPSFDLVFIHPSFIEGRNDLVTSAENVFEGTNAIVLGMAVGKANPGMALPGVTVHNDDVARLHVEALNPKIPAGSYGASWNSDETLSGSRWETVAEIVKKHFSDFSPNAIKSIPVKFDTSSTEKVFGWKFQSLEGQVQSVVGHYVELLAAKA